MEEPATAPAAPALNRRRVGEGSGESIIDSPSSSLSFTRVGEWEEEGKGRGVGKPLGWAESGTTSLTCFMLSPA